MVNERILQRGRPGQSLAYRKSVGMGHQAEYHSGAALRFEDSGLFGRGKVSLRTSSGGDFVELGAREGFSPRGLTGDGEPVELFKFSPYGGNSGTRQLIHPDGTTDIMFGEFRTGAWMGAEFVARATYIGKVPGELPKGLRESEDGQWIEIDAPSFFRRIPLPVKPAFFALKQPISEDSRLMAEDIREHTASFPKLAPVRGYYYAE
jgi:hypothetical protein